jgi:predicted ArsR family transcriptional regulator
MDHLATLTIFGDEDLVAALVKTRLAPLTQVRENQQELLADTLLAWLELNMNANAVATRLHVHPQTVRRRLRQLDRLFGDQVHDGDVRFELEIALRAERAGRTDRLRRRGAASAPSRAGTRLGAAAANAGPNRRPAKLSAQARRRSQRVGGFVAS